MCEVRHEVRREVRYECELRCEVRREVRYECEVVSYPGWAMVR